MVFLLVLATGTAWAGGGKKAVDHHQSVSIPLTSDGCDHQGSGGEDKTAHEGEGGDHDQKHPGDKHSGGGHSGEMHYDTDYSFFGTVRWSGGEVIVGNRRLIGDNPWLGLLAPGMRLEVQGEVEGDAILARKIEVRFPRSWSFYEGPAELIGLSGGRTKVWLSESDGLVIFKQMAAADSATIKLAACYQAGKWRAIPEGLTLKLSPASWGWWLLEGSEATDGLHWRLLEKLPGGCQ